MPLIRRLPKRGFNNAAFHKRYAIVNLSDLNEFKTGAIVNEQLLREVKLVRGDVAGIKILGDGELKQALKIAADKVSASAREKIDKVGGTIILRDRRAEKSAAARKDAELTGQEASAKRATKLTGKKRSTNRSRAKRKLPKNKTSRRL